MTERTYGGHTAADLRALCNEKHIHDLAPGYRYARISEQTAALYDAARNALPALLDRVAALEASLDEALSVIVGTAQRTTGYDWNADPDRMTLRHGAIMQRGIAMLGMEARNDR